MARSLLLGIFLRSLLFTSAATAQSGSAVASPSIVKSEPIVQPSVAAAAAKPVDAAAAAQPLASGSSSSSSVANTLAVAAVARASVTFKNTILILARDAASGEEASSGLNGYGIPFEVLLVPQAGVALPNLNSSLTAGNYGGIIIVSEVAYQYTAGWGSALTAAQWQQIYSYQTDFGVRLVRIDVFPTAEFGVTTAVAGAGCCDAGVEQLISISNNTAFPTANLKTGQGVSTQGLWHYPATITNSSIAVEFAQFAPAGVFTTATSAGVINNFGSRQQLVWFISWGAAWSQGTNFIQHAHIHWLTRGLFVGRRRILVSAQVDDLLLTSDIYKPAGTTFRLRTTDLQSHVTWQTQLNARLPAGSSFIMELAHNGNGNIDAAYNTNKGHCTPEAIDYEEGPDPPLEFKKPLGTGTNLWPATPLTYGWTAACIADDPLSAWFKVVANRNAFAHMSHTFTHENQNNATYADVAKEIKFNQVWLDQIGLSGAPKFSPKGLVPPAITGLHNGDAIKALLDNGIKYVVGDLSRPLLGNTINKHWPLITTVADNGYAGLVIIPRWPLPIYYNCDTADCTTQEWIDTSAGGPDFAALLAYAKTYYTRALLGLDHSPYMFHQANMRANDVQSWSVGTVTGKLSLLQIFIETIVQEMGRLTTWPIVTLKHDDIGVAYVNRMTQDQCKPNLTYQVSADGKTITGVTVTATGNTCSVPIPVTFPVAATTSATGVTSEQLGTDPLTKWTPLKGSAVTYTLSTPVKI